MTQDPQPPQPGQPSAVLPLVLLAIVASSFLAGIWINMSTRAQTVTRQELAMKIEDGASAIPLKLLTKSERADLEKLRMWESIAALANSITPFGWSRGELETVNAALQSSGSKPKVLTKWLETGGFG